MGSLASRLWSGVRRHGVPGGARRLADRTAKFVYLREAHFWYELDLGRQPPLPLPAGLKLLRGEREDAELLERLPTGSVRQAEARLAEGAGLWLVVEAREPAFACWIFHGRTPVRAARGGWLTLPERTACLEDSVTSPAYRGLGVAPAAWSQIAATVAEGPYDAMVTKVSEDNAASRRAVEKAGFRETALMNLARTGFRERVRVEPRGDAPVGHALAARLRR